METEANNHAVTARLLVVDDDDAIRDFLAKSLTARGYGVATAPNCAEMDRILAREPIDLIILDVMMPGEDGLMACRRLAAASGPPVIILSALGAEEDRILGLELGANHYLSKPCSPREILAHVRAALRHRDRLAEEPRNVLSFEGWRVDLDSNELFDPENVLVHLTAGEFAVLRVFVERPRRILTREALLEAARGSDSEAFDRAIDVQVSRLRRKFATAEDRLIRTVRNEGYMFTAQVRRL